MTARAPGASSSKVSDPAASESQQTAWFASFRPHFVEWVFGPIERLMHTDDALVAFILMSCAIDYLAGFWWGKTTKGETGDAYAGFIQRYFPSRGYDPEGLYDSLRNGLVHMFTIKHRRYALTHNNPKLHLVTDAKSQLLLNAADFYADLRAAAEVYFNEVATSQDLLAKAYDRYSREGFLDVSELKLQ